jgi:hypothetical protein
MVAFKGLNTSVTSGPAPTLWRLVPLLPLKLVSPPYVAVIVRPPATVEVSEQLPAPLLSVIGIGQAAPVSSLTFTVPDGVPPNWGLTLTLTE